MFGFSQIGLVENFDSGLAVPVGWTTDAGDYFGAVVQVCDVISQRVNLDNTNTSAFLDSPNFVGQSNGTDLTITFDYKVVDWSAGTDATLPGWGNILVQYSTNNGGVWNTIETINDANHVTSAVCANFSTSVLATNLPTGSDFKFRLFSNWAAGSYYLYIDNVIASQVVVDPPSCSTLTMPTNGETGVDINANLAWAAATGIPTGYTLSVGTIPGETDIVNNLDVALSTTYDLPTLSYSTVYYVTITPYNANGDAVGCTEESFTTGADPNAPVDCASGIPINTIFCYTNSDTTTFSFISSDGSPLVVVFNSGSTENNYDELIVLDSDGVTNINPTPYGVGGDLTGLVFTSTGDTITVGVTSDGSVVSCTNDPWNFDVSCLDTTALPNCNSVLTSPINAEIDVNENADINWSPATIFVTGYFVSIGTTPGGTDIANNVDVGNVLTYNSGTLAYATQYYVTITPYNTNGSATGCIEESFTTRNDPNQIVDCASGVPINTVYCYTNNDTMQFNFASSDGSPLVVVFNSGTTENNFDELIVLDSDGVTNINPTPYGVGGDLTGLLFTSTGDTITVGVTSDGSVVSCTNDPWNFDVSCVDTTALPNCNAVLTSPINGQTDVNENADINWSAATIFVTGYFVSIGTTPGGTDIANAVDVGNVLTYAPGTLTSGTTYYVTIVPYNTNGSATGCIEESYTVRNIPSPPVGVTCSTGSSSFIFTEDFETDPANGWTGTTFSGDNGDWQITPGNANSFNTGPFASFNGGMHLEYEASGSATDIANAISPAIDLTSAIDGAELSFYIHAFGADMGTLNIGVGNSTTGPFTNIFSLGGEYHTSDTEAWLPVGLNFDAYLGQVIYLQFSYGGAGTGFEGDMSIDYIRVEACGSFCIAPSDLTVANITATTADISWTANSGELAWEYVVILAGTGPPAGPGTPTTTNPTTVTGLTASTNYEVYIRADCGADGFSLWAGPMPFTTQIGPIDCASGVPLNVVYCYDNNDTSTWLFTSTTGFPLNILFNAGYIEAGWDEIIIYDGADNTAPILFQGDNGGDLTGIAFTSTGDSLFLEISSDGIISCVSGGNTPMDFDIWCQTCLPQTANYNIIGDCDNQEFTIDVDITDMGDATDLTISDDQGSPNQTATGIGIVTFGPYPANIDVVITVSNTNDGNCIVDSGTLTFVCPPPPNDCSIIYAGADATVDCDNPDTDLTAIFHLFGQDTNTYEINALTACPTPPTTGGVPTSLVIDDTWSDVINMTFDFCFFGQTYNQIVVGSNGVLTFDLANANTGNGWAFTETLPNNTNPSLAEANIFGVAHDIDPSVCGDINYVCFRFCSF